MRMRALRRVRSAGGNGTFLVDSKVAVVPSTGPGSIRCESEIQRLLDAGKLGEAHRLAVNHLRECGGDERRIKPKYRPDAIERLIMERNDIGSSS